MNSPDCLGVTQPSATTQFEGTRWYIPGGTNYDNAQVVTRYFDNEEQAKAWAAFYRDAPESGEYHAYVPNKHPAHFAA